MKGIIMTGGNGTRLYPVTKSINKSLLPVYDKPLIYYSLSVLMTAGINDIILLTGRRDFKLFRNLLGDGSQLGLHLNYRIEEVQLGTAGAFIYGRDLIGHDPFAVILGDNAFFGPEIAADIKAATNSFRKEGGPQLVCSYVDNPQDFGVVRLDKEGKLISLDRRSQNPKSSCAVTGLFYFENETLERLKDAEHAKDADEANNRFRGMLDQYPHEGKLHHYILDKSTIWYDVGRPGRLYEASRAVRHFQEKTGTYAGCIEEIAYKNGWIDRKQIRRLAAGLQGTEYGSYLMGL